MADGAGQTPPDAPGPTGSGQQHPTGPPPSGEGGPPPGSWGPPPEDSPGQRPPEAGPPGNWQIPRSGEQPAWPPAEPQGPPPGGQPGSQPPTGWSTPGGPGQGPQQGPPGWGPQQGPPHWGPSPWGGPPVAPKPGVIPLRPLSVGEILDGIFTTIRTNPGATLGLTFGATAVVETVNTVAAIASDDASTGALVGLNLFIFALSTTLQIFLSGVLAVVVSEAALGSRISAGAAIQRVAPRLLGLLGLSLAVMALSALGLIALVVGAIVVAVYLSLASPAYVLEGQSVRAALRRSTRLVRGSWWRVFGITLLSVIVGGILMLVITLATGAVLVTSDSLMDPIDSDLTVAGHIVNAIGTLIGSTLATPVLAGTVILLYIDQRIRREGLDVTLAETARQRAASP